MRRGEIWTANFNPGRDTDIGKIRPSIIMQADWLTGTGITTVYAIPLTTQLRHDHANYGVLIPARGRLKADSVALADKMKPLVRRRFGEGPLATIEPEEMAAIEEKLRLVLGMMD